MPALYFLGQHAALEAVQAQLREGEHLFAFLDDVYVLCQPERAREVFDLLESKLLEHTGIHLHLGKTKVYNKAGVEPPRVRELQQKPEEPVWVGDRSLSKDKQGLKVLGTPLGSHFGSSYFGSRSYKDVSMHF